MYNNIIVFGVFMKVKVKLTRGAVCPEYATNGSAAVDMRAMTEEPYTLKPGERHLFTTGVAIAPETKGVVAILAARSGLGVKHGIALANGIGVIDSDYRGEICVGLCNNSDKEYTVNPGDRIAQLMFIPVENAEFTVCDDLDETERGAGGFGSTGKK